MLNGFGEVLGLLVGMPMAGLIVVAAGSIVGNMMKEPGFPRWQVYIALFILGWVVTHVPEVHGAITGMTDGY